MKKNILKLGFALAVVVAAGYTVYSSQTSLKMTGIALNNVEALASGEGNFICRTNIDYTAICNYYDIWDPCPCGF